MPLLITVRFLGMIPRGIIGCSTIGTLVQRVLWLLLKLAISFSANNPTIQLERISSYRAN